MKKIIPILLAGMFLFTYVPAMKAQGGTLITAENMSPQVRAIIQNVKNELALNPNQLMKFRNDYIVFLNKNQRNMTAYSGNQAKLEDETKKLLVQTGTRFRSYLNDGQFTKLSQMIQAGQLDPAKYTGPTGSTETNPVPVQKVAAKPNTGVSASLAVQSNTAGVFEQLAPYMKVTSDQSARVMPILREYDQRAMEIKKSGAANTKSQLDALNATTIPKLKTILNDDQITKMVMANTMEENILSGKNLNMEQRAFLQKLQSQYGLNDVQTMAVVLVMVEGKVRGDAINQVAKSNPQGAAQELGKLMSDLDMRLKSALNNDQYLKVKADIERMLKGQKI